MKSNKIYIIGGPGSGKTFLSKKLSEKLKIKHYDLDDIFWIKKYSQKRDEKERVILVNNLLKNKNWIIEGVYTSKWANKIYKQASLVILLDIKLPTLIYNLFKRYITNKDYRKSTSVKGTLELFAFAKRYRSKKYEKGHHKHLKLIKQYKPNLVIIKNKKQLKEFVDSLST